MAVVTAWLGYVRPELGCAHNARRRRVAVVSVVHIVEGDGDLGIRHLLVVLERLHRACGVVQAAVLAQTAGVETLLGGAVAAADPGRPCRFHELEGCRVGEGLGQRGDAENHDGACALCQTPEVYGPNVTGDVAGIIDSPCIGNSRGGAYASPREKRYVSTILLLALFAGDKGMRK